MAKSDRSRMSSAVRCAIYTRKSSDEGLEQEFNSLDAQREACEAYIKSQKHAGWGVLPDMYDDGGLSGGTMERAALLRLLDKVRAGGVDVIVVYKVDRLTRSLADFAKIVEILDAHRVSFVSVTQQFNTTTSMGRLTLNVLLSFAQFEREITGERIRDKIAASKKKGMWMGGNVPLGYCARDRRLVVSEAEAKTVRFIFMRYAELGTVSLLQEEITRLGIVSKQRDEKTGRGRGGNNLSRGALYHMLNNRIYRGEIVHQGAVYPGLHEVVIEQGLWDVVQQKLETNRTERSLGAGTRQPSLLTGLIVDGEGTVMTPTHAVKKGKRYRYYVSSHLGRGEQNRNFTRLRIPAWDIEALVVDRLRSLLSSRKQLGDAMSPLCLDADVQHAMFARATELADQWPGLPEIEVRAFVRGTVEKVTADVDRLQVKVSRSGILAILLEDEPGMRKPGARPGDDHIVLEIESRLARAGKGLRLIIGDGQSHRTNPGLAKLIAEAFSIRDQFLSGTDDSIELMSKRLGLGKGYLTSRIRLTYLAPDIVRSILDGRDPVGLSPTRLLSKSKDLPHGWAEQRIFLGFAKP